ncbi:MAG TPA: diguanylate cyclase [Pseudomonas sp.]|nr:diguanylate cyclase [Pseudomonas sp.]
MSAPNLSRTLAWALGGSLLYYLSARFGMQVFALQPSNMTLLWLASGIGVVMISRLGWQAWPLVLFASLAANYPGMKLGGPEHAWLHALIAAAADTLTAVLAARMLLRSLPGGLSTARDLGRFSLYVCLLPAMLGGCIIAANLAWGGYLSWPAALQLLRPLVLADSLGILLVWPLYQACSELGWPRREEWVWLLLVGLLNLGLLALAGNGQGGFIYFMLPALLLLVVKVRLQGVYLILLLSMVAIIATAARGLGPFQAAQATEAHFMLMGLVFTDTLVTLSLALYYRQLLAADESRQHWQSEAMHDPLTGLLNRRAFTPLLINEHQRVNRTQRPFALALLDLDHFKKVNDEHGHTIGDGVLVQLAALMLAQVRDIDTVARIGGEEFAILFPESSAEAAAQALERIRLALAAQPLEVSGRRIAITISSGVVEFAGGGQSAEQLLEAADAQLYRAKHGGRNCVMRAEQLLPLAV